MNKRMDGRKNFLKKILVSLGIVALVAVLGISVVFAYGSYKDLELKKEEAKLEQKKSKDKPKKQQNESQQIDKEEQAPIENTDSQQVEAPQQVDNTAEAKESTEEKINLDNDYNGDGAISKDEMTPEQERLFKEGKFQPTKAEYGQTEESNSNNEQAVDKDWDEQAAYEAQKKIYEKAARGEIAEPGATR